MRKRPNDVEKLDQISQSINPDGKGNLTVDKNLGVDGKLTLKSLVSASNPDGDITKELGGGKLYRHYIELNGTNNGRIYLNYYTSRKEAFNSIADFIKEVSITDIACSGTIKVNDLYHNVISIGTASPSSIYARYYTTESPYTDIKDVSNFFMRDDVYNI